MNNSIPNLWHGYFDWLRSQSSIEDIGEWFEITSPLLDRHNDFIQIYVKQEEDGRFFLTDAGHTIQDLSQSGCNLDSDKRRAFLKMATNGFGVTIKDGALTARASADDFASRKHNLLQAVLAVNDLFYLAQPYVVSLFFEDVTEWMTENEIRFVRFAKFTGKSGFDHRFDFVIPKSKHAPDRFVEVITNPARSTIETLAFKWMDMADERESDSSCFAFLNDKIQPVSVNIVEALEQYGVKPILWSEREKSRPALVA